MTQRGLSKDSHSHTEGFLGQVFFHSIQIMPLSNPRLSNTSCNYQE